MTRGLDETRRAVRGADRALPVVIEGGRGRGGPPQDDTRQDDGCPVTCLGHLAGKFYFLDAKGQQVALGARAVGNRHEMIALFNGSDTWLRAKFPRTVEVKRVQDGKEVVGEDGKTVIDRPTVDFQINKAAQDLIFRCSEQGLWGEHMHVRQTGVWPDGAGGVVVHCGNGVLFGNEWLPAGHRSGNTLWALAAQQKRPGSACDTSIARTLQDDIRALFNFRVPGGEIVILGLLGTAYFGGAARWRSSGFLVGPGGCGKTQLLDVMAACCPMHWYSNDTSKAGMVDGLDGRAMPSFIDENEKSGGNPDAAQNLLDLILTSASGKGTRGSRGGVDGRGRRFEVVTSVVMAATAPPDMRETHLGRFALVELEKPREGEDHLAAHEALKIRMEKLAPELWGRALASWERYGRALEAFRAELGVAGCAPRERDQLGAILAGWWILTHEGDPGPRGSLEGVGAIAGFVRSADIVAEDSNSRRLVQYLMTKAITMDRSTAREPVGTLIMHVLRDGKSEFKPYADHSAEVGVNTAKRALAVHGIRVVRAGELDDKQKPVPCLSMGGGIWLNSRSTELAALFNGSDWAGPRWVVGLLEMDGCKRSKRAVRVGAVAQKALWLPLEDLQIGDGDVAADDAAPDG